MRKCIGDMTIRRQPDDLLHKSPNRARRSPTGSNRTRLLRLLLASVSAAALTALSAGPAAAQINVWTGTTSNDWAVGSNWSTGTVIGLQGSTTIAAATQVYVRYDGGVGGGTDNHAINLGMRFTW
jgi:hypothetical protein